MRVKRLAHLGLCASVTHAFKDTSPFLLYSSNSPGIQFPSSEHVAQSSHVASRILESQRGCGSQSYIVVSQPDVSLWDLQQNGAVPHLEKRMAIKSAPESYSTYQVPEVLGQIDGNAIAEQLKNQCGIQRSNVSGDTALDFQKLWMEESKPTVLYVTFERLPTSLKDRQKHLAANDFLLEEIVSSAPEPHTVIYTTTPPSAEVQAAQQRAARASNHHGANDHIEEHAHIDLKRSLYQRQDDNNDSKQGRGLFEKYNFFSPGLFMTIMASLLMIVIIYIGISALGSLEITYMAFSKEMGPKAQNKQQ